MGINITQFAPPSRVSSLVWDKNMEPPAGKVFEGDLTGNVTGDLTGDVTGDVTGKIICGGCSWSKSSGDILLIQGVTSPLTHNAYDSTVPVKYPYLGIERFMPVGPKLRFSCSMPNDFPGYSAWAECIVTYADSTSDVTRFDDVISSYYDIDLSNVVSIRLRCQGTYASSTAYRKVSVSLESLYVTPPYDDME